MSMWTEWTTAGRKCIQGTIIKVSYSRISFDAKGFFLFFFFLSFRRIENYEIRVFDFNRTNKSRKKGNPSHAFNSEIGSPRYDRIQIRFVFMLLKYDTKTVSTATDKRSFGYFYSGFWGRKKRIKMEKQSIQKWIWYWN